MCLRHTKPGGYLEVHDIDPSFYCDDDTLPKTVVLVSGPSSSLKPAPSFGVLYLALTHTRRGWRKPALWTLKKGYISGRQPWPKDPHLKEIGAVS
jgi:hypothetical protein